MASPGNVRTGENRTNRVEYLVEVVQALSHARTLERVQEITRTAARRLTGADGATFVLRDGDQCFYADEDAIEPLWKGRRFPLSACISGWAMLHRQPTVIEDIYADDRVPHEAYRPTFVKSLVMVPIRSAEPIGAIGNYWAARHAATEEEVKLLQALADSVSVALENVQLYATLQDQVETARRAESAVRRELVQREQVERELRLSEERLRHAHKMEAIGQFAAGIAHDFNNVLSVVLSFSTLVLEDLGPTDAMRGDIQEIQRAGERAAALTRQILAFSRQQALEPRALDVNQVVAGIEKMVRRILGEHIRLEVHPEETVSPVWMDAGQLEQVLINLVANARDAMPRGGRLSIETANVELDADAAATYPGAVAGPYTMLAVSDTGTGMDAATQARIFDPFFTTKGAGKGTGLGLAMVYGITKQSGGHVWVYSEVGRGTTFRVYLPQVRGAAHTVEVKGVTPPASLGGTETVLLVEDDEQVRTVARGILRRNGYEVLEARSVGEAIVLCTEHPRAIHLLLTDVVMPQMDGPQLARQLVAARPAMRVISMSGYTNEAALLHGFIDATTAFLQKPITPRSLLTKVRQVLDTQPPTR